MKDWATATPVATANCARICGEREPVACCGLPGVFGANGSYDFPTLRSFRWRLIAERFDAAVGEDEVEFGVIECGHPWRG